MSGKRLLAIARKELLQLRRDKRSLALAFLVPALLVVIFGYAITWDIRDIPTAVLDEDNSQASRALLERFRSSGYFTIVRELDRSSEADPLLSRGRIRIALHIPPTFSADLGAGRPARVQALVDGSDANTATIALGYARAIVASYSADIELAGRHIRPPIEARTRVWFNEELKSRNMIVPGLVAVIMMIISALLTSLTIAREWERGTMEQLVSTPVRREEVVLGKLLPYVAIGIVDVAIVSILGIVVFGVPFRGDPFLLFVLSLCFLFGALGVGMFVSALARSQLKATQLSMLTSYLPAFLLSGFMYPIDVMPTALRLITTLIPARYFLVVTRGIFLKGVGIDILYPQAFFMLVYALLGVFAAIRAFKKEISG
jgi:ABC-2 type transport system permease protein